MAKCKKIRVPESVLTEFVEINSETGNAFIEAEECQRDLLDWLDGQGYMPSDVIATRKARYGKAYAGDYIPLYKILGCMQSKELKGCNPLAGGYSFKELCVAVYKVAWRVAVGCGENIRKNGVGKHLPECKSPQGYQLLCPISADISNIDREFYEWQKETVKQAQTGNDEQVGKVLSILEGSGGQNRYARLTEAPQTYLEIARARVELARAQLELAQAELALAEAEERKRANISEG